MKKSSLYSLFLILILLLIPAVSSGQSDLFEIRTPNVMIIFDTSSSMNMSLTGQAVPSGNAKGVDGVIRNYEGGGDHPNSKLFIAKQGLRDALIGIENVNLGFATFGQRKEEMWKGYYKKWSIVQSYQPAKNWCEKRYWRWREIKNSVDGPRYANDFSSDSFIDFWGTKHTGVTEGYRFYRTIYIHDKPASSIPPHSNLKTKSYNWWYTVTKKKFNAEYNYYTYTYVSDPLTYDLYEEKIMSLDPCNSCSSDKENDPFPVTWPDGTNPPWETYFKDDSRGSAYKEEYDKPFGNNPARKNWWDCKPKNTPEKPEVWDWVFQWRSYKGKKDDVCKDRPDGWKYVDGCYDVSNYYYPIGPSAPALPYDTTNRPHTWSYFRISGGIWPESIQPNPYYPAIPDDPGNSDNNFFFLNFPEIDDSINNYANREKILKWLDLMPVQNPETLRWHTKLPLKPDSITSNTIESLYTPLADTLAQAKKYFYDYIYNYKGGDEATKALCRGNYIILLTDGLESARLKGEDEPDYDAAANIAKDLFKLVKDKNDKPAGVKTYVVGFGADLKANKPESLKMIADSGGTEKVYFAGNLNELRNAFISIFQEIGGTYSRSNPVVAVGKDAIYRAYFTLPGWKGHLVAYKLDSNGNVGPKKWDAGEVLNSSGRGTVYSWADEGFEPKREELKPGNAEKFKDKGKYLLNPPIEEDMNWDNVNKKIGDGKIDKEDAEAVINFVLDPSYKKYFDGSKDIYPYTGNRSPDWKLGDIYHSTPLVVSAPPFNFSDMLFPKKYSDFKKAWKNRTTMVYVGANDGMLHAFDSSDGREKFAITPRNLLGKLRRIRQNHEFFIDSSPRAYDVYFRKGKKKDEWATIVVSGLRGGGNYYFALDATDPADPQLLWEMTDPGMGNTWSRPEIGRVKLNGEEKFVLFVGGGYSDPSDSTYDNTGNTFYVIDIEDGTILRKFVVGNAKNKIPAGATAFDHDQDGRVDGVYFGDIQGILWKIKIDKEENINNWQLIKLYEPSVKNPIFYPPAVTKNNEGKILVYFGQGDETNIFEKSKYYYFFEIWDKGSSGEKVWEIKFGNPGEKVLAAPTIGNNIIYFTTWEYTGISEDCGAGKGRLYGLTMTRAGVEGGQAGLLLDPLTGEKLPTPKKYFNLTDFFPEARGIPSAPVLVSGRFYISSSLWGGVGRGFIPPWTRGRLKYWREVF